MGRLTEFLPGRGEGVKTDRRKERPALHKREDAGGGGSRLAGCRRSGVKPTLPSFGITPDLVPDEPDPAWLDRAEVRRGLRALAGAGLVYDLLVRPAQLPAAIRVARDLPGLSFVLDHGGKPGIARGEYEPWASLVGELAACPNVVGKLSGLVTEAGPHWSAAQIGPYASHLIDSFGPRRLMVGSDWPVCTLAASYGEVLDLAVSLLSSRLGAADVAAVLAVNAQAIYRLRLP